MLTWAATGDTWGIAGPTFLRFYLLVVPISFVAALAWRRWVRHRAAGPAQGDNTGRHLTPGEVGFLTAGPARAVLAELAVLRSAGVLTARHGQLERTGSPPAGLDPLGTAVYNAVPGQTRAGIVRHSWVRAALADVERGLGHAGLVLDAPARARTRLAGWAVLAIALLGLARTVAGLTNDRPVGYVALATIAASLLGTYAVAVLPRRTAAGDRALAALRARYAHLAADRHPAWSAYGAAAAGIGVGVFGASALLAGDPGLRRAGRDHP